MRYPICSLVAVALLTAAMAHGQTSYPMVTHASPVAVQRGQTTEVLIEGKMNFHGAYQILIEGDGVAAEIVPGPEAKTTLGRVPTVTQVKARFTVATDATPGVREFRVATSLGVSSVGQIVVVDDPVIPEAKVNDTAAEAQQLQLPCVLAGRLEKDEDVDYYAFEAKAGDRLTFEVQCARLQDKIHDLQEHAKPMVVLYDAEGRELAAHDHFYFADPLLTYNVTAPGKYYLQIRESTYQGDPRWVYAVLATDRPYASHVYPMAGNPGQEVSVEPVGSAAAVSTAARLKAPDRVGVTEARLEVGGVKTNPFTFIVSPLPQVLEAEGNDTPQTATEVTLPCGINGRFAQPRDLDHFAFPAKKGESVTFEVQARRFGTLLNSTAHTVIDVLAADGKVLAKSIDSHGTEPALTFQPPADGKYVLRVRDLNSKGGPAAIYHVEAAPAAPDFDLECDGDKAMVGPGSGQPWFFKVTRKNGFTGAVKVDIEGLPAGVTASPLTIPESLTQGVVVLTAGGAAEPAAANVQSIGTGTAGGRTLVRRAAVKQEIYSPGGGRAVFDVATQVVAVTGPSDVREVKPGSDRVVLRPGEEVKVEVEVARGPGYDKAVSLDVPLRHLGRVYADPLPPGVTVVAGKSKTLLGPGVGKGHIVLKAEPGAAPCEDVPVAVLAQVSINFVVKVSYASRPVLISVRK